jgi:hypothetical protein
MCENFLNEKYQWKNIIVSIADHESEKGKSWINYLPGVLCFIEELGLAFHKYLI